MAHASRSVGGRQRRWDLAPLVSAVAKPPDVKPAEVIGGGDYDFWGARHRRHGFSVPRPAKELQAHRTWLRPIVAPHHRSSNLRCSYVSCRVAIWSISAL
jgi:hypothetical protein